jgi:hypothetical protein
MRHRITRRPRRNTRRLRRLQRRLIRRVRVETTPGPHARQLLLDPLRV